MKKLSNTEAEMKKNVASKKRVYYNNIAGSLMFPEDVTG